MASKKKGTKQTTKATEQVDPNLVPLTRIDKAVKGGKGKASKDKRVSALDAAAKVLVESKEPMSCPDMIEAMADKG